MGLVIFRRPYRKTRTGNRSTAIMKKHWVTFADEWTRGPMSHSVHRKVSKKSSKAPEEYDPPLPALVPGKGYPTYHVEFDGFTFVFASIDELDECLRVLSQKLLPTTIQLCAENGHGLSNAHWFSRLPGMVKPWRYREKAVAYLAKARESFLLELADA